MTPEPPELQGSLVCRSDVSGSSSAGIGRARIGPLVELGAGAAVSYRADEQQFAGDEAWADQAVVWRLDA